MAFYLWGHGGSRHHGSEALIRGLCTLLSQPPDVFSLCPEEDWQYGLTHLAGVYRQEDTLPLPTGQGNTYVELCGSFSQGFSAKQMKALEKSGDKVLLFGYCPKETISPAELRRLEKAYAIFVWDKRSLCLLQRAKLGEKTYLCPNPALLSPAETQSFPEETLGIHISPLLFRMEYRDGIVFAAYQQLMDWILTNTSYHIALIPCTVKALCNDYLPLQLLWERFAHTGRVTLIPDGDCRKIAGAIGACRLFLGADDWGALAACSACVPSLRIGCTPGAVSLAGAVLGDPRKAVLPVGQIRRPEDLTRQFQQFSQGQEQIRRQLKHALPGLRTRACSTAPLLRQLVG